MDKIESNNGKRFEYDKTPNIIDDILAEPLKLIKYYDIDLKNIINISPKKAIIILNYGMIILLRG